MKPNHDFSHLQAENKSAKTFQFKKTPPPKSISNIHWNDWKWQMRNSLKTLNDFRSVFQLSPEEEKAFHQKIFSIKTTPYYAELCRQHTPLRKMTLPHSKELSGLGLQDPLGENKHSPVPRIIHRYPDRVLFLITDFCGIYCRYCTRKYFTAGGRHCASNKEFSSALRYIQKNKGIREVILSGGDPLTLSDNKLETTLKAIRAIPHVEIIRIGTRMPACCPFRVTPELVHTLNQYQPIFIMTHFNHPKEITEECRKALLAFSCNGISVYNQMVLLAGINNHPAVVQALSRRLLYLRVRPYYMFQCDPSKGTEHFRTTIENSKWIQKKLWGTLSGLAIPRLSMDLPGGGGKVELVPDHFIEKKEDTSSHRGFDNMVSGYQNPKKSTLPKEDEMAEELKEWEQIHTQTYGA